MFVDVVTLSLSSDLDEADLGPFYAPQQVTFLGLSLPWTIASISGMLLFGSAAALTRSVLLEMSESFLSAESDLVELDLTHAHPSLVLSRVGQVVSGSSHDCESRRTRRC